MITSGGTAPYAPAKAVLDVIHAWRDRPVPTPITAEVMEKIGISASIVPRTLQTFRLLDLLDKNGNPSPAMQDLRKAGGDEYRTRLAEIIRAAYAEVFTYRDPAIDSPDKIADAFRSFEPVGMRDRMVRLFLGLCSEAGIIESKPRVSRAGTSGPRPKPVKPSGDVRSAEPATAGPPGATGPTGPQSPLPSGPTGPSGLQAGADHMAIRGLLQTLPPVGSVFPDAKRNEWAKAVLAAFNMIYERSPEDSQPCIELTPSGSEG